METAIPEITAFAPAGDGRRNRSFTVGGCNVLITPAEADDPSAERLAAAIARLAVGAASRYVELEVQLAEAKERAFTAQRDLRAAQAQIPPKTPAKLLAPGFVRFQGERMFLMNRRERGFGEFGIEVDGWDDLFRRYSVKVTGHGADAHGLWWEVSP